MTATFQWMTQNISMPDFDRAKVEAWLVEVAGTHGRVARELSYVFCDDARIIEVNREFLSSMTIIRISSLLTIVTDG